MPKKHRNIEKGLSTVGAIDNVGHDSSSATAKCSFHGTCISVCERNESNLPHKKFVFENKTHFQCLNFLKIPEN